VLAVGIAIVLWGLIGWAGEPIMREAP